MTVQHVVMLNWLKSLEFDDKTGPDPQDSNTVNESTSCTVSSPDFLCFRHGLPRVLLNGCIYTNYAALSRRQT